jgi:cell division protein FtsI/penicillin-binding protein 2
MNYNFSHRIRFTLSVFFLFAFIIICKLYWIQIVKGDLYSQKSDSQYSKPITVNYDRGSIFFESKDGVKIGAATVKEGYTLAINPKILKNEEGVYDTLSEYIKLDRESFIDKASKKNDPYEEIQKKLEKGVGESIQNLKIPGVILLKDAWRVYPGDTLAAHSIGLIGSDDKNNVAGRYGLERFHENVLSRNTQGVKTNIFAEVFSEIKKTVFSDEKREADILISIEPTVQSYLEKTLGEIQSRWSSDSVGAIIMDPKTGAIYGLASRPTFNPNDLKDIKDPKIFSNALVEDVREMGSIIKPLTMAVGIDTGTVEIDSTYDDKGFLELNGKKISNFDKKPRGVVSMQEILSQSLNIGAATIAIDTGHDKFVKYFKGLGLGELTGIDQPNEQRGIIKNLDSNRDIELATASYGQGIALTPIETIRALSTLANDGLLIKPHITKKIEYTDGSSELIDYPPTRIFKKETTDDVTRMLVKVVDTALKKGTVKMEHYSIAAKTGTAQIANPATKGYYDDRYLHSFFGYFPAYNPRFIVFIYHVYPKDIEYASETLTDPFIQITKFLINYYELPPDR